MPISPDLIVLGRAALAGALGFAVGWERESHGHAAGIRTVALISMGSAIITSIALIGFPVADRLVANILTGVGFLGAGMIVHARAEHVIGLTSAAAIWAMTGVSIVIGLGHYLLGIGLLLWWQFIPLLTRFTPTPTRHTMAAWRAAHHPGDAPPSPMP